MSDRTRGLFEKFIVRRTDGTSGAGQKHDGCEYFVLDMTHDPYAKSAAQAYVDACKADYPLLAADMVRDFKLRAEAPATDTGLTISATDSEVEFLTLAAGLRAQSVEDYVKRAINAAMRKQGVDAVLFKESDDE